MYIFWVATKHKKTSYFLPIYTEIVDNHCTLGFCFRFHVHKNYILFVGSWFICCSLVGLVVKRISCPACESLFFLYSTISLPAKYFLPFVMSSTC